MSGVGLPELVLLAVIGLVGGIGITAVGPGGVLPTIGLLTLTGLSPAQVAGTAIVTHIATGALGTAAYTRSGQLRERHTRRTALILAATALAGTPLGVLAGTLVSKHAFAVVLGGVVALAAGLVWYRARRPNALFAHPPATSIIAIGLAVSAVAGIVGIGGPMLTVRKHRLASCHARRSPRARRSARGLEDRPRTSHPRTEKRPRRDAVRARRLPHIPGLTHPELTHSS
jgi:uncharacterized membrane protein YfcA